MNVWIYSYKQIWHEWISEYIRKRKIDTNECPNRYPRPIFSNIFVTLWYHHTYYYEDILIPVQASLAPKGYDVSKRTPHWPHTCWTWYRGELTFQIITIILHRCQVHWHIQCRREVLSRFHIRPPEPVECNHPLPTWRWSWWPFRENLFSSSSILRFLDRILQMLFQTCCLRGDSMAHFGWIFGKLPKEGGVISDPKNFVAVFR